MNKIKYLFLASIAALSLTACDSASSTKGNTLPSGGTTIDVTTEAGSIEVKQKLSKNIQETVKGLNSVKITSTLDNTNYTAKVSTTGLSQSPIQGVTVQDIDATLKVKDLKAKAEFQLLGLDKTYADLQGVASLNVNGGISFTGNLPDVSNLSVEGKSATVSNKKYSYSLTAKDVDLLAYYKDNTLYGDFSDEGLYSLVEDVDTTAKKVLTDFPMLTSYVKDINILDSFNSFLGTSKKISYDFTSLIGEKATDKILPEINDEDIDNLDEYLTEVLTYLVEVNNKYNFNIVTFKKYENGRFGLSYSLNKDQYIQLILSTYVEWDNENEQSSSTNVLSTIKDELNESIKKFEIKGAVLFDENGLLTKYGTSENIKINSSYPISIVDNEIVSKINVEMEVSSGFTTEIAYNQAIQLPSDLSGFTPIKFSD